MKAFSQGQITRRDLLKMGLIAVGGLLVPISSLGQRAGNSSAVPPPLAIDIPTGLPPSPLFGVQAFTQPMPRFDVLQREAVSDCTPTPTEKSFTPADYSNAPLRPVPPELGGGSGPLEGRPPGAIWAHQLWNQFQPNAVIEVAVEGAKANTVYNPGAPSSLNSGINPAAPFPQRFHPGLPDQSPSALWTFNGTLPPKLAQVRYHDPVVFRVHNELPADATRNGGFGRHTVSIHETQRAPWCGERRVYRRLFLPRPVLRLPLSGGARGLQNHQHRCHRSQGLQPR